MSRRARRWLIALAVLALLFLAALGLAWFMAQPQRLVPLLLGRAGAELGLELRIDGRPEYALRPEPRLVLPGFSATLPGETDPILRAERVELALPWATLRSGGADLAITRIVLVAPDADLPGIRRWLAARPESDAGLRLPTLREGLRVERGRLRDEGWAIDGLDLDLPFLAEGAPARLRASGTWVDGEARRAFAADLAATPFLADGRFALEKLALDLRGESPLPTLRAEGRAAYGEQVELALAGALADWPADWPALPEALPASDAPVAFEAHYAGALALDAPLALKVERGDTAAEAELAVPALRAWLDAGMPEPLPPLRGRLVTPRLEFGGVVLHGVEARIEDDATEDADGR
ncbi:hypothetical protein [Coralloluteibacterium thermophilus]|uniref:AsmA family protein n=1 Tax=Coralloluteibacterium thermophilum TaxID=2707049 RepID=A0ABV9NIL7_9GAMM